MDRDVYAKLISKLKNGEDKIETFDTLGKQEVMEGVTSTIGTIDTHLAAKVKDVVTVFVTVSLTDAISGSATLLTGLPKSYVNYAPIRILNASTAAFLDGYIDNQGAVTVKGTAASGNSLRFCATYLWKE